MAVWLYTICMYMYCTHHSCTVCPWLTKIISCQSLSLLQRKSCSLYLPLTPCLPASAVALVWRANGKAAKRANCLYSSGVLLVNEIRDGLEGTTWSRWPNGIVCLGHASRLTALAWHCRHWLQTLFMWLPHAYKSVHCLLLVGRATCVPTYFSTLHLTPLLRPAVWPMKVHFMEVLNKR